MLLLFLIRRGLKVIPNRFAKTLCSEYSRLSELGHLGVNVGFFGRLLVESTELFFLFFLAGYSFSLVVQIVIILH